MEESQVWEWGHAYLADMRLKISTYTSALTLVLNLLSIGSQGKIESYMQNQGGELEEIRRSLNWITASMQAEMQGDASSILTKSTIDENDEKAVWRDFRRALIMEGYSSNVIQKHKETIKDYITELGDRGALDDVTVEEGVESPDISSSHEDRSYGGAVPVAERQDTLQSEQQSLVVDQAGESSHPFIIDERPLSPPSLPEAMENIRGVRSRPLNHSNMPEPQSLPPRFPCWCRAVYSWGGEVCVL